MERNAEEAERLREAFKKRTEFYPYPADIQGERELMEIARRRAAGKMEIGT